MTDRSFDLQRNPISALQKTKVSQVEPERYEIAGRVVAVRKMSTVTFYDVRDSSGTIQVALFKGPYSNAVPLKVGDIAFFHGYLFYSKSGELTLGLQRPPILQAVCKRSMPDKEKGLRVGHAVQKHRVPQLMTNQEVRQNLLGRSELILSIRRFLSLNLFQEVDTPILQREPTVGTAAPFQVHSEYLGHGLFLRGTCEIHLKQLVVAGMERVYEIGQVFRNESTALIEFPLLEILCAFSDMYGMAELVESMLRYAAAHLAGGVRETPAGTLHWDPFRGDANWPERSWKRLLLRDAIEEQLGYDLFSADTRELNALAERLPKAHCNIDLELRRALLCQQLITHELAPRLQDPTFLLGYPSPLSPLAARSKRDARFAERGYLFIAGRRICEVVSEQTDTDAQEEAFRAQDAAETWGGRNHGHSVLTEALAYGCPPLGGVGLNINRLLSVFTGSNRIEETTFFPLGPGLLAR